jgi:hypothetical protein
MKPDSAISLNSAQGVPGHLPHHRAELRLASDSRSPSPCARSLCLLLIAPAPDSPLRSDNAVQCEVVCCGRYHLSGWKQLDAQTESDYIISLSAYQSELVRHGSIPSKGRLWVEV